MLHQELVSSLEELRLTAIKREYSSLASLALKEKYSYEQYLSMLVNSELEHRKETKLKRLLKLAKLPTMKRIDEYQFDKIKGVSSKEINDLATGEFIEKTENIVFFGDIGVGKTHLAIGLVKKLCEKGIRCFFTSTSNLIEMLEDAQKGLNLANLWKKFDKYQLIVCDELGYIPQSKNGADLFFQFISERYERRSILITTNLQYSNWDQVFLDKTTTMAAVDRIVHHSKTFNIIGPSWRKTQAKSN